MWVVCPQGRGLHPRELLNGSLLFPGENDIEQLCCVLCILVPPALKCGQFAGRLLLGGVGQVPFRLRRLVTPLLHHLLRPHAPWPHTGYQGHNDPRGGGHVMGGCE